MLYEINRDFWLLGEGLKNNSLMFSHTKEY